MYSTTITKSVEQSLAYIAAAERSCSIGAWPESLGNGGRQVKDVLETVIGKASDGADVALDRLYGNTAERSERPFPGHIP